MPPLWMSPITLPPSPKRTTASPLAVRPVELIDAVQTASPSISNVPLKPYWLHGRGSACAGGAAVRTPAAARAVAAANNWDLVKSVAWDIGVLSVGRLPSVETVCRHAMADGDRAVK